MPMKKCDAGLHFYDDQKHASCPYCAMHASSGSGGGGGDETIGINTTRGGMTEGMTGGTETVPYPGASGHGGHTASYASLDDAEEGVTVGIFQKKAGFSPVMGWIVCIDGKERGKDYRVKSGINTVGKHDTSDIVIKGDETISRNDHAEIEYDPDENSYYLIRKKNPEVRLNGSRIRQPEQLKAYDRIQFGETVFLFVPLCTEDFKWSLD